MNYIPVPGGILGYTLGLATDPPFYGSLEQFHAGQGD